MNKNLCGCCEGLEKLTPRPVANRPGLPALAYRAGTHATFLETMKARLTDLYLEVPGEQGSEEKARIYPLRSLTTREANDPAIAWLDAWATVADVLTFYQERIANEGYLRTATERRSILELARLVGYKLRSGVAASVYLAFALENGRQVEIPAGARAQSRPGPGELPQSFETAEPIMARAEWNALNSRQTKPQFITSTTHTIYLRGTNTNLKPNDPLLLIDAYGQPYFRKVLRIELQAAADRTRVILTTKGEVDLELVELETLIQSARIPEEEGPYSVAIGDRAAQEIQQAMMALLALLRDPAQPTARLKQEILIQMPRLAQTHRIYLALNFDILARWVQKVQRQLKAILRRLQLRPEDLSQAGSQVKNPKEVAGEIATILKEETPQSPSGKAFAKEIGERGLEVVKESMIKLISTLYKENGDNEKVLAVRAAVLCLDQLEYVFREMGFGELSEWVEKLSDRLETATIEDFTIPEVGKIRFTISLFNSLTRVISSLLKTPSAQRVRARWLKRMRRRIFSVKADIFPQLLKVMKPSLRLALYPALRNIITRPGPAKVYALRTTASLFGYNVPRQVEYDPATNLPKLPKDWPEWTPADDEMKNVIFLDNAYDKIIPGSYIVIQKPGESPQIFGNVEVTIRPRTAYGLSTKTTEITLPAGGEWWEPDYENREDFKFIRGTSVYAQSELLDLAGEPIETDVQGSTIELDGMYDSLESGRWLIVSGERSNVPGKSGVRISERVMLAGVTHDVQQVELDDVTTEDLPGDTIHTTLQLANNLAYTYQRDTVTIYGNVVKATHGETHQEVLGSGEGSQARQHFTLKRSPLTYLAAPTPAGAGSTLEVRVNDVRWPETDNLFDLGSDSRGYISRADNEDKITIIFGDGRYGVRLPTGVENVRAVYRSGLGQAGNVAAEQISMLATRPPGVKTVINPLPATGGADRESRDQARGNAPLAVMALDRLVSVQDYADFARTYAGIGKASAVRLSDGRREVIHLTIAGADDVPIDVTSDLYHNLGQALHRYGDPHQPLQVELRELMLLVISAGVCLWPDYEWESVEPKIRVALLEAFSFDRRELGQDVLLSEVIRVMQAIPGVAYVDVDLLDSISESESSDLSALADKFAKLAGENQAEGQRVNEEKQPEKRIPVEMARPVTENGKRTIKPAQLAYLSPEPALKDTLILNWLA